MLDIHLLFELYDFFLLILKKHMQSAITGINVSEVFNQILEVIKQGSTQRYFVDSFLSCIFLYI